MVVVVVVTTDMVGIPEVVLCSIDNKMSCLSTVISSRYST